jgi:phage baseplate assembly protein W
MAFDAKYIFPIDQNARAAVGVNLPFSGNSVFTPNFTTKDAIRYNLINFCLTNTGERPLNPNFGANLRQKLFEQVSGKTLAGIEDSFGELIKTYFPFVIVDELTVQGYADSNVILITLKYSVQDTGITDTISLEFI